MRSAIHVSVMLVALGVGLGLVTAQHRAAVSDQTVGLRTSHHASPAAIVDDYDQEMDQATGSINLAAAARLSLSDLERGAVFLGVINLPDIPELDMRTPQPGAPVSQDVELQEFPPMVVRRVPQLGSYRLVKLQDRILLVSAQTREVEVMFARYKLVFH